MRTVIFHYHLFKNAGTSLDAALKENFEEGEWVTKEFPAQPQLNREQVKQWVIDNPQAKCFSSHTALLPPPVIDDVKILPIIFVRNPIDRIASAYSFEKKQGGDSFGAVLARNTTFSGYVETRISLPHDHQCRNFHIERLSTMFGEKKGNKLERASLAVMTLPFIGVVEQFSQCLVYLEEWLNSEGLEGIKLKPLEKNVSRNSISSIDEKINKIKNQLGADIYEKILEANTDDYEIYGEIVEKLNGKN